MWITDQNGNLLNLFLILYIRIRKMKNESYCIEALSVVDTQHILYESKVKDKIDNIFKIMSNNLKRVHVTFSNDSNPNS